MSEQVERSAEKDATCRSVFPGQSHACGGHPASAAPEGDEVGRWVAVWRDLLSDKTYRDALLVTAGLMETQHITAECRANRTVDGAWDEAVRRLREIYDAQVEHDPEITLGLTIGRVVNRPAAEVDHG